VADLRSDEVHKVGWLGWDAAPVPGFEEFGLEVGRKQTEHATPFSPVLGGQVAKRLVVTKVVGINTPNATWARTAAKSIPGSYGDRASRAGCLTT